MPSFVLVSGASQGLLLDARLGTYKIQGAALGAQSQQQCRPCDPLQVCMLMVVEVGRVVPCKLPAAR